MPTRSVPIAARPAPEDDADVENPIFVGEVEPREEDPWEDSDCGIVLRRMALFGGFVAVVMLSLMPWWAPPDPPAHPAARTPSSAGHARK